MPRIVGEKIENKLMIPDKFAGGFCTIFYRPGTTEERIAYPSAQWERKDGLIRNRRREALLEYGELVILGFEEGYFQEKMEDGTLRTVSSDPASKNYDLNWKAFLRKYAPDVLEAIAEHVFESPTAIPFQGEAYTQKN